MKSGRRDEQRRKTNSKVNIDRREFMRRYVDPDGHCGDGRWPLGGNWPDGVDISSEGLDI